MKSKFIKFQDYFIKRKKRKDLTKKYAKIFIELKKLTDITEKETLDISEVFYVFHKINDIFLFACQPYLTKKEKRNYKPEFIIPNRNGMTIKVNTDLFEGDIKIRNKIIEINVNKKI